MRRDDGQGLRYQQKGTSTVTQRHPGGRPVKIGDVARAAGVSVGTVSKAMNGRSDVGAQTALRVRDIAAQLGFRPNQLARSLPTGRSFSVGLLTTDSYGRFSIPLMLGAEDALGSGDVAVVFCDTRDDPERETRQLQALLSRHVDGIIVNGRRTEAREPLRVVDGVPVVYAFAPSADRHDCSVVPDDAAGAVLAIDRLLATGRRRIAHVTGPRRHLSAASRAAAARDRLGAHGLSVRGRVRFGEWSEQSGRDTVSALLDSGAAPDALFCGSDQIARGAMDTLQSQGLRVPDDVAVIGFDNWAPMTDGASPTLTSIDMNIDLIGRVAAEHLLAAINGEVPPRRTVVAPRLVERDSA